MADIKVQSNASAVAADMQAAARRVLDVLAKEVAAAANDFSMDIRGPSPGEGLAPYLTGNLVNRGRVKVDGVRVNYLNDAKPYRLVGGDAVVHPGESYASFARKKDDPEGQFAADAEDAFNKHFDDEFEARAEAALMAVLDV